MPRPPAFRPPGPGAPRFRLQPAGYPRSDAQTFFRGPPAGAVISRAGGRARSAVARRRRFAGRRRTVTRGGTAGRHGRRTRALPTRPTPPARRLRDHVRQAAPATPTGLPGTHTAQPRPRPGSARPGARSHAGTGARPRARPGPAAATASGTRPGAAATAATHTGPGTGTRPRPGTTALPGHPPAARRPGGRPRLSTVPSCGPGGPRGGTGVAGPSGTSSAVGGG